MTKYLDRRGTLALFASAAATSFAVPAFAYHDGGLQAPAPRTTTPRNNRMTEADGLCCTNGVRDSLFESGMVAGGHEQLVPYEVQDQELAFVQHGAEAARFAIDLV